MKKNKTIIPKLTEVKLKNFTPEELKTIEMLKKNLGEKTASGVFKYMLNKYIEISKANSLLLRANEDYIELIELFKRISDIVKTKL